MEIFIEVQNNEGATVFNKTCHSFEQAEEALGSAERYMGKREVEALAELEDDNF